MCSQIGTPARSSAVCAGRDMSAMSSMFKEFDADECHTRSDQPLACIDSEERVAGEVTLCAPMAREFGANEQRLAAEVACRQRIRANRATAVGRIDNDGLEVREALERKAGEVSPITESMSRCVDIGPGISTQVQ